MRDLVIYGFGGFGHEVACVVAHINRVKPTWNIIGYIDDSIPVGTECKHGKVLGDRNILNEWQTPVDVAIAIGSPQYLTEISKAITNPLVSFPNIIAPNVFYFDKDSVSMGQGNIITFGCRMSCDIHIGNFNILDGNISLGHDVVLGDANMMFPEVRISGQTEIGNQNFFGARTFVSQCLKIGDGNRFGAGTYILRKIKNDGLYMGNPAKKVSIE